MLGQNDGYIDFGECSYVCAYCGALFWHEECAKNSSKLKYNLCCQGGKISLPLPKQTPPFLDKLFDYKGGVKTSKFRENIRAYNFMFSFTSFGANIQSEINKSTGPHIFKISGQIHHLMGSLVPPKDEPPKFAQLYIYDTEHELENRLKTFHNENDSKNLLDLEVIQGLTELLNETNKLVKLCRTIKDRFKENSIIPLKLKLLEKRKRVSNYPRM